MQNDYHFVILSGCEESPKIVNERGILHSVQDNRAKSLAETHFAPPLLNRSMLKFSLEH